jgi:hypothetical protein
MTNFVLLNSEEHRNLKVRTDFGEDFGDGGSLVEVVPQEFRNVATNYPIMVTQFEEGGKFTACALLGLDLGENLYIVDGKWDATYVPLHVQRGPFRIGIQQKDGTDQPDMVISIDTDSGRVTEAEGEPLFEEDGSPSEYLKYMNAVLSKLVAGSEAAKIFAATLEKFDLVKPMDISIEFADGKTGKVQGLHSIDEDKLKALSGDDLKELNENGVLMLLHIIIGSLAQIDRLIDRKSALLQ